ncbi:MAG TPA: undecaprenyldiphospho-muramoylpentapeptide beta-N-acetylglucosaminyltransferase [Mariprofundaceae bacterium]|nr:undecaprenyldiphospho-muramoylpentapeptide beta-N-acetylglucosaminyltransferase [Mariprofundaceae bacterium]
MSRQPILCIAGGGTGGHVMPAIALADAARERWPGLTVQFIGAERGLEARLLPERGEEVLLLSMHGIKGAGLLQRLRVACWELPQAIRRIRTSWQGRRPDLVVGVGGYASASGVLAALVSRIPVVLYEQNAMPGLVNRLLARFCKKIMLGFAAAKEHLHRAPCVVTGNMVRAAIAAVRWQPHIPSRLLVMGGSQGARFLNDTVPDACVQLAAQGYSFTVTHLAGNDAATCQQVAERYAQAGIEATVLPFCDDMPAFFSSGDLLIARSGAMTVAEAASCGMPSLFVPLPIAADDHQRFNAEALASVGGAEVLNQRDTSAGTLAATLTRLLFSPDRLAEMSSASLTAAPLEARRKQLEVLTEFLAVEGAKQ